MRWQSFIGALLDSNAVPDFQNPTDPAGFEATVEETDDTITFQVRNVDGSADTPQVDITVDGTPPQLFNLTLSSSHLIGRRLRGGRQVLFRVAGRAC